MSREERKRNGLSFGVWCSSAGMVIRMRAGARNRRSSSGSGSNDSSFNIVVAFFEAPTEVVYIVYVLDRRTHCLGRFEPRVSNVASSPAAAYCGFIDRTTPTHIGGWGTFYLLEYLLDYLLGSGSQVS